MAAKRKVAKERRDKHGEQSESKSDCCAATSGATDSGHESPKRVVSKESNQGINKITLLLVGAALVLMIFNQFQLMSIKASEAGIPLATGVATVAASVSPTGTPKVYGSEIGIKYDDIDPDDPQKADKTIAKLQKYDETITLKGKDLERYVTIASQISCEYCCGAGSIIVRKEDIEQLNQQIEEAISTGKITKEQAEQYRRQNQRNAGDAACSCAHSFAMRGLAKYLITNHGGAEFSDEQILEEMAKWKTLFFPQIMAQKAVVMKEKNIEFTYANLGSNSYRGIEKGAASAGGNMVGGC